MKPLIGVPPDTHAGEKLPVRSKTEKIIYLWDSYLNALIDHGAAPVVLPVTGDKALIRSFLERIDGLLLAGGNFDVPPAYYREKPKPWLGALKPERSAFELAMLKGAIKKGVPVLGICGGHQIMNVVKGGSLYQDILKDRPGSQDHQQKVKKTTPFHKVRVEADTLLARVTGLPKCGGRLPVNSTHHQAIKDLGRGLIASAYAPDGLIEAIEAGSGPYYIGVQWHPELLYPKHPAQSGILAAFVRSARSR